MKTPQPIHRFFLLPLALLMVPLLSFANEETKEQTPIRLSEGSGHNRDSQVSTDCKVKQLRDWQQTSVQANPIVYTVDETNSENLEINGDYTTYDESNQIATAFGNVNIAFEDVVIKCESVLLALDTMLLTAIGDVQFRRGEKTLKVSKLTYHIETGKIIIPPIKSPGE